MEWTEITANVNKTREITRKAGDKEYKLVFKEINGDQYEDIQIRAEMEAHGDDSKGAKLLAQYLRQTMFVSVAGKDYDIKMDREMPVWLRKDLDTFILQYARGFL